MDTTTNGQTPTQTQERDPEKLDHVGEPAVLRLLGNRATYTVYGSVFTAHQVKAMIFTRQAVLRGQISDGVLAGEEVAA